MADTGGSRHRVEPCARGGLRDLAIRPVYRTPPDLAERDEVLLGAIADCDRLAWANLESGERRGECPLVRLACVFASLPRSRRNYSSPWLRCSESRRVARCWSRARAASRGSWTGAQEGASCLLHTGRSADRTCGRGVRRIALLLPGRGGRRWCSRAGAWSSLRRVIGLWRGASGGGSLSSAVTRKRARSVHRSDRRSRPGYVVEASSCAAELATVVHERFPRQRDDAGNPGVSDSPRLASLSWKARIVAHVTSPSVLDHLPGAISTQLPARCPDSIRMYSKSTALLGDRS